VAFRRWRRGAFTLLVSRELLNEYSTVMHYDRIRSRHHLSSGLIAREISLLRELAELVVVEHVPRVVIADPKDDMVIACAAAGNADYIISGDRHLLALQQHQGIDIVTVAGFLRLLDAGEA
jgi:putative PIN family toxin of toxin-antitoxin system